MLGEFIDWHATKVRGSANRADNNPDHSPFSCSHSSSLSARSRLLALRNQAAQVHVIVHALLPASVCLLLLQAVVSAMGMASYAQRSSAHRPGPECCPAASRMFVPVQLLSLLCYACFGAD
jgi:hypothetical protein